MFLKYQDVKNQILIPQYPILRFETLDWRRKWKKLAVKWTVLLSNDSGFMRLPTRRDENGIVELSCLRLIRFLVYRQNIAVMFYLDVRLLLIVWKSIRPRGIVFCSVLLEIVCGKRNPLLNNTSFNSNLSNKFICDFKRFLSLCFNVS